MFGRKLDPDTRIVVAIYASQIVVFALGAIYVL